MYESLSISDPTSALWGDIVQNVREEYLSDAQSYPWIIGFSGGKDSTLVAQAVFEALLSIAPSKRTRHVHIVSNDTLVESPLVLAHLAKVQKEINEAAINFGLPMTVATTQPEIDKSFWVLLIGKGYPSPNQTMRWCTDRLKIQPTSKYILDNVSQHGAAVVILGVRLDESNSRRNSINKFKNEENSNLTPHQELSGAYIYRPIVDMTIDDVWEVLGRFDPPWGGTHQGLIQLYRDAEGGECPVVLSKEEAPGCGTASSRFGCWTCTVVEKDKSLQGFVDAGKSQYECLIQFRDWLREIRNKPEYRSLERRNGEIRFDTRGNQIQHVPGPFTIQARRMILEELLRTQEQYGDLLIRQDEIDLIQTIWAEDLNRKLGGTNDRDLLGRPATLGR
ncbi:DNA phosphorothioation system sulfurtransferase DndC [Methylobacillus sp. Pita1]|uniref:DNA phosphorothioation system sulfurtransferase DndC n=1 Tax=Methylobacillus sp. Pita1 TaxID=3382642 RepID=UPI0038B423B4